MYQNNPYIYVSIWKYELSPDPNWVRMMNDEMEGSKSYMVYYIFPLNRKPIGCRWVYKIKYIPNGEVEMYNARLVVKVYFQ